MTQINLGKNNLPVPFFVTEWFRSTYKLEKRGDIDYISYKDGSKIKKYSPNVDPIEKQPQRPQEWKTMPHIHLARLNTSKTEEVLDFANHWGLLGLWKVKEYREWFPPQYERSLYTDKATGESFSVHYINPDYVSNRSRYYYQRYQEPLLAFIKASNEYKSMITLLEGDADDKSDAEEIINKYIMEIQPVLSYRADPEGHWSTHWNSPSLLHTCYYNVWMDLMALRKYRKCSHHRCNSIFAITRDGISLDDNAYCSYRCKNNAMRKKYYEKEGK